MPWNKETILEIANTFKERHALIEGFYDGFRGKPGANREVLEKYKGDVWYVKGGFVFGSIVSLKTFWLVLGIIIGALVTL